MWRPILGLPRPLLSHLRPHVRRHNATDDHAVLRVRSGLIGSSRSYASDASNDAAAAEIAAPRADRGRLSPAKAKQHLYVLLDDRKNARSIHKLDVDGGGGGDDDDDDRLMNAGEIASTKTLPRLPEPPVLRLQSPTVYNHSEFITVGSSLVTMGECFSDPYDHRDPESKGFTLV